MTDRDEKRADWPADRGATEPRNGTVDKPKTQTTPGECSVRNECIAPTLTDAEREAIHWVLGDVADITGPVEDTLRGLLERLQ